MRSAAPARFRARVGTTGGASHSTLARAADAVGTAIADEQRQAQAVNKKAAELEEAVRKQRAKTDQADHDAKAANARLWEAQHEAQRHTNAVSAVQADLSAVTASATEIARAKLAIDSLHEDIKKRTRVEAEQTAQLLAKMGKVNQHMAQTLQNGGATATPAMSLDAEPHLSAVKIARACLELLYFAVEEDAMKGQLAGAPTEEQTGMVAPGTREAHDAIVSHVDKARKAVEAAINRI